MSFRRVSLEVIQCRHCDKLFQTSEKHLCNALLCQNCFDIREGNRKGYPKVIHAKAERNIGGDKYGENRGCKIVVCAACGNQYEVYKRLTDQLSRSCLEDAIKSNPQRYSDGPLNGWTNDILCKICFENVQVGHEDEIKLTHEIESERTQNEAAQKLEDEAHRRNTEYEDAVSNKNFWRLMQILFVIFTIPILFSMCSRIDSVDKNSGDIYYRK